MIDHAARRANARAFVAQELKKGRAWASLTYVYDKPAQPEKEREHDNAELKHRMDRPHV